MSLKPAIHLFEALQPNVDIIALNKWGKKVLLRFFSVDHKFMDISSLMNRICSTVSSFKVLSKLIVERRGVNVLLSIIDSIPPELAKIIKDGIANFVLCGNEIEGTCLGIHSSAVHSTLMTELSFMMIDVQLIPLTIPLSVLCLRLPAVEKSLRLAFSSDWTPLCISASNNEFWRKIFAEFSSRDKHLSTYIYPDTLNSSDE